MNSPLGQVDIYPGYQAIVFLHDNGIFSTVIARSSDDQALAALRLTEVFDAAARGDPRAGRLDRPGPFSSVHPGSGRRPAAQHLPGPARRRRRRRPARAGVRRRHRVHHEPRRRAGCRHLAAAGPANCSGCSTNDSDDLVAATLAFDAWCTDNIAPWFDDHVYWDADLARRWAGGDVDLSRPLPSDLIVAAAEADPALFPLVGPYLGMRALPASLDAAQPRAREIYASGWRPPRPRRPHARRARRAGRRARLRQSALTRAVPGQAAGSTVTRWSQSVRPSRNRTPSAHRASTAPPANCSV